MKKLLLLVLVMACDSNKVTGIEVKHSCTIYSNQINHDEFGNTYSMTFIKQFDTCPNPLPIGWTLIAN